MLLTPVGSCSEIAGTFDRSVNQMMDSGDYAAAASVLRETARDYESLNRLGVCLLRLGRSNEAVDVYRRFVLQPGTTWTQPSLPGFYKRNFATALALKGIPSGALEVLQESGDMESLYAVRLRSAILQWADKLPFFQRLDWYFNRVDPRNAMVYLEFEPGELAEDASWAHPPTPAAPNQTSSSSYARLAA